MDIDEKCIDTKKFDIKFDYILELTRVDQTLGMIFGTPYYVKNLPYELFHRKGLHWENNIIDKWCRFTILSYLSQIYLDYNIGKQEMVRTDRSLFTQIAKLLPRINHSEISSFIYWTAEIICANKYVLEIVRSYIIFKLIIEKKQKSENPGEYKDFKYSEIIKKFDNIVDNLGTLLHKIFRKCRDEIIINIEENEKILETLIDNIEKSIEIIFITGEEDRNLYEIAVCVNRLRNENLKLEEDQLGLVVSRDQRDYVGFPAP
jgi:hypothetical protein